MATFFRNKAVKEIGKVKVPIYSAGPSTTATVVGLSLANLTESVVSTSVLIADDTSIEAFYLKDVLLRLDKLLFRLEMSKVLQVGTVRTIILLIGKQSARI